MQVRWRKARSEGGEGRRGSEEGGSQGLTAGCCRTSLGRPRRDLPPHETTRGTPGRRRYRDVVFATVRVAIITYPVRGREVGGYCRYRAGGAVGKGFERRRATGKLVHRA